MDWEVALKTHRCGRDYMECVLALPLNEQAHFASTIMYNVRKKVSEEMPELAPRKSVAERAEELLGIASEVVGVEMSDNTRKQEIVMGRRMVMYQLYNEGVSPRNISEVMNRGRDVIQYNVNQFENMLQMPRLYKMEMNWWLAFQDKINYSK